MNKKTSKKELLSIIESDIVAYLNSGKLSINEYIRELDLNIDGLDMLLKIHFLLDERVKKYILNLNSNIHKFNTSIQKQEIINKGKVKGHVLWSKSLQIRNNINPKDKGIFVCNENIKNYNTNENIILKYFLNIIYSLFKNDEINDFFKYDWFEDCKEVKKIVENIYLKNIYLSRIDIKNIVIDQKTLNNVSKSRNKLYSEAAKLIKYYFRIMKLDNAEIIKMLRSTFIEVSEDYTLFELFWVLKIIKDNAIDRKMYILDKKNKKVAEWENNEKIYTIYHNSSGSKEISFKVHVDEIKGIKNNVVEKQVKIINDTNKIASKLFDGQNINKQMLFDGRPDIIIEIREKERKKLLKVIVCEIKHTIDKDYSIQGLKELIEYMNYIKQNLEDSYKYVSEINDVKVEGILFLDKISVNEINESNIKVITMNNVKNKLEL